MEDLSSVRSACNNCYIAKKGCDRLIPCSACAQHDLVCKYTRIDRRRRSEVEVRTDYLKSEVDRLESLVRRLKSGTLPDAIMTLEQLRSSNSMEETTLSPASQRYDRGEGPSTMYSSVDNATLQPSSLDIMPNESTTSLAIKSFFEFVNPVFFITTPERCSNLMSSIYHNDNQPAIPDICELCAIAAAGCQFNDTITEATSSSFELNSSRTLIGKSGPRGLQGMKCCLGLSQYWEMKDMSKMRCLLAYAAELARQSVPDISSEVPQVIEWVHWTMVFRTVKMLQCWISVLLNHQVSLAEREIEMIHYLATIEPRPGDGSPVEYGTVLSQLSKIALSGAEFFSSPSFDPKSPWDTMDNSTKTLDIWRKDLPENVQLRRLLSSGDGNDNGYGLSERSSLLVTHVVYLTTRLIGYKRKFETCGSFELLGAPKDALDTCAEFARQLGWIISLLSRHGPFLRCWLVSYASFISSNTLILIVCWSILKDPDRDTILRDLSGIQSSIDLLAMVTDPSSTVSYFARTLKPLHDELKKIVTKFGSLSHQWRDSRMSVQTILNTQNLFDPSEVVALIGEVIGAMEIPDHL